MLSFAEKKFVVEKWFETKSYTVVRRALRTRAGYHTKNLPSISSLQRVVDKFKFYGTLYDRRKGRLSAIKDSDIKKVERVYRVKQKVSLRCTSRRLGFSFR